MLALFKRYDLSSQLIIIALTGIVLLVQILSVKYEMSAEHHSYLYISLNRYFLTHKILGTAIALILATISAFLGQFLFKRYRILNAKTYAPILVIALSLCMFPEFGAFQFYQLQALILFYIFFIAYSLHEKKDDSPKNNRTIHLLGFTMGFGMLFDREFWLLLPLVLFIINQFSIFNIQKFLLFMQGVFLAFALAIMLHYLFFGTQGINSYMPILPEVKAYFPSSFKFGLLYSYFFFALAVVVSLLFKWVDIPGKLKSYYRSFVYWNIFMLILFYLFQDISYFYWFYLSFAGLFIYIIIHSKNIIFRNFLIMTYIFLFVLNHLPEEWLLIQLKNVFNLQ